MEIGSFLELQFPQGREYYNQINDIARLNTGRMALWHALRVQGLNKIWLPIYQCDSVRDTFMKKNVSIKYYRIDENFNPIDVNADDDEAVMLVNYYGIMSHKRMSDLANSFSNPIIDNCQAFFCDPVENAMNVYSCRKFVGVPDGAYVIGEHANNYLDEYPQGFSSDTAAFLLKRIEYGCEGEGYRSRTVNENRIDSEDIMKMSALTRTILDGEDYDYNKAKRKENFKIAESLFGKINKIDVTKYLDSETVPMVYPLVVEDDSLLHRLQKAKHFQGHWWSYICDEQPEDNFEYWLSRYVIPITIDQRYGKRELDYLAKIIFNHE